MRTPTRKFGTLAATLSAGVFLFAAQASAQNTSPPSTTATRPAKVLPDQTSAPSNAPPATTGQTTGETSRDPTIKKMNDDEKRKVDSKGK
ncbi:hypothetical protein [Bradyrhizobium mercantei]|uniref:hypothetical protein n=1 Tax=Bradyrhizobium mercantei TaxID=1904807 RepID=UPI000978BB88|nr:hypothetical protein [Bradyrhizobium mercantei]